VERGERLVALLFPEHRREFFEGLVQRVVAVVLVPLVAAGEDAVAEHRGDLVPDLADIALAQFEAVRDEVGIHHVEVPVERVERLLADAVLVQRGEAVSVHRDAGNPVVVLGVVPRGEPDALGGVPAQRDAHVGPAPVVRHPRLRDGVEPDLTHRFDRDRVAARRSG
jgi:hypothetical protein